MPSTPPVTYNWGDAQRRLPGVPPLSSRSFSTNVAFTLIATVAPGLAAMATLPALLGLLGSERLGVLTLAWVAIGSFALLDAGLGRALTHETSTLLASGRDGEIRSVVRASLALLAAVGTAVALAVLFGADAIVRGLRASSELAPEIRTAVMVCALAVPLMTVSSGLRGVLEARGRFDVTSLVRVALGIATYVGPWLAAWTSNSLALAVGSIVAARLIAVVVLLAVVDAALPAGQPDSAGARWGHVRRTLAGGAWMTIAGTAGALLAVVDRAILGSMVSLTAIAYYATPQEVIGKLTLLPMALSAVLFPALSAAAARGTPDVDRLFERGLRYTFVFVVPLAAIGAGLANEWIGLWLGREFAASSARVAQWFCISVLLQSLAVTPLNLLQAAGQAPVTAWLQTIQVPLFAAAVWFAVSVLGIEGAALVWVVRMALDLGLMLWLCGRRSSSLAVVSRRWAVIVAVAVLFFAVLMGSGTLAARSTILVLGLAVFAVSIPSLMGPEDLTYWRSMIASRLRLGTNLP